MRRYVFLLLLFSLLLLPAAGCAAGKGTAENTAPPVYTPGASPAGLSGEMERVTDHKWRLTFREEGGELWRYREEYTLLRKTEEGYLPVTALNELPPFDHRLYGGQEKKISVNLAYAYGELPAGDYLLQKPFLSLAAHPEEAETDWELVPPEHFTLLEVPFTLPEDLPAASRPSDPWDYLLYQGQTLQKGDIAVWGEDFTSAGGTLVLENRGEAEEIYGYDWTLYFREGKEWLPVPMSERPGSLLLGPIVAPGEQVRQELSFEPLYGLLPPGTYRLVQPLDLENGTGLQFDFTLGENGKDEATSSAPRAVLEDMDPEAIEALSFQYAMVGARSLQRGEAGFGESLELLSSLRGIPCPGPKRAVERRIDLDGRRLFLMYDGIRVYATWDQGDHLALEAGERPDEALEALFLRYGTSDARPYPADYTDYIEDGSLTVSVDPPAYDLGEIQASFAHCIEANGRLEDPDPEKARAAWIPVTLENHGTEEMDYDGPYLEALRKGTWIRVPTKAGWTTALTLRQVPAGENLAENLALLMYDDELPPGRYRAAVVYAVGQNPRDRVSFAEFELREEQVSSAASGEALLTVSCGGETVVPYPAFLWAETWTEFGWLNADGIPLEFTVQEHWEEIPVLTPEGADELSVSPGHGVQYSGRMDVYDENMDRLFRQWEEDPAVLASLEPGTYLCALRVTVTGDYIASEDRHERTGYQCLFRLLIPEGAG